MLKALIITLIKPGKNPNVPQNVRPISLLNIDLKLYAKLIALRMVNIMPILINPDQFGFTKGHETADATRRLINIIQLANINKTPSLLLALDAEKVFDRIHWTYLVWVLSDFGFEGPIHSAILALYTQLSAQVFISGALSTPFFILNGTPQGCPLSPLIFNLRMEPLATNIHKHSQISDFLVQKRTHTISLFADDIILMLTNPEQSLVHSALQLFNKVSYYKVNETKSYILDLGVPMAIKKKLTSQYPYVWNQEGVNYLAITLTPIVGNLVTDIYLPFVNKLRSKRQELAKVELTWSGRLATFKTYSELYPFLCPTFFS